VCCNRRDGAAEAATYLLSLLIVEPASTFDNNADLISIDHADGHIKLSIALVI
jgi:hypothetical protein